LTDYSSVANAHVVNWGEAYNNKSFGTYIQSSSDNVSTYLHGTGLVSSEKVTDRWEHWTITYDGFKVNMYKNGVQVSDKTVTSLQTGLSGLWIGARMGGGDFFNGAIDDIRIYDRPLNSAEIKALYHIYDPQPPFVIDTHPDNNTSIGVSDNMTVTFSEGIDPSTLNDSITLTRDNGTQVAIDNLTFDNSSSPFTLTIDPSAAYTADNYTLDISTALEDLSGNALRKAFQLHYKATQ